MAKPKVIFLDAVGTLFGVKGSVGEIYGAIAAKFGVNVDFKLLDLAFYQSFQDSPRLAFPEAKPETIPNLEFAWWKAIASSTFEIAGVKELFPNFDEFFAELYTYFATSKPWLLYSDTIPALTIWQKQGIELGIISNFDTRINQVLEALNLTPYFQTVTISSLTGIAKPEPEIFNQALAKHDCEPESAWYIGDSLREDYCGAKAAGIKSFLIQRQ
jgi:putative hydrolase of the HAD superfamily